LTAHYRFPLASVTKSMVAAETFRLVDQHRLTTDDTVDRLLPGLLTHGKQITVADLLSHRSGLPDPVNDRRYQKLIPATGEVTGRQVVRAVSGAPLDFHPGTSARYSNTNYEVLGLIVEKLTGQSLDRELSARLFNPLRMRTASLTREDLADAPLAHGYFLDRDVTTSGLHVTAGDAVMTAGDLDRFLEALFHRGLVSHRSLGAMTHRWDGSLLGWQGYGYGLAMRDTGCGRAYGHSGRVDGYVSEAWSIPSRRRSVVVLTNRDDNGDSGGPVQPLVTTALCGQG
jgi:D-alanyl-D-alanine carboxypeptidase